MATAKTRSRPPSDPGRREDLIRAATQLLTTVGFAGATTRAIAAQAKCNVGLISYYFGGLNNLLLEALDRSAAERMAAYQDALAGTRGLRDLRKRTAKLYREDHSSGHVRLLAEMLAGGLMDRSLGGAVAERVTPWLDLTEAAVRQAVPAPLRRRVPAREIAYAVVAMFLGLEMLGSLAGDHARGQQVVERLASTRWITKNNPAENPQGG